MVCFGQNRLNQFLNLKNIRILIAYIIVARLHAVRVETLCVLQQCFQKLLLAEISYDKANSL
jgi:hypothetical protein